MQTIEDTKSVPAIVTDEVALLASLVPLEGARVAELGCGNGDFARKLAAKTPVHSVTAFELDKIQHRKNVAAPRIERLSFAFGGAEDIAFASASLDGVVMVKSLHHVPMVSLDRALDEIARVLKPGGWFYAAEPVGEGPFNDIIKLFHDEAKVHDAAYQALGRAHLRGALREDRELSFKVPMSFRDFDDFEARIIGATHAKHSLSDELLATVRTRFEEHMTPAGAKFIRPMRVNLMRRD